ncbi:MAG: glycerate kinase [Actinomycetaceae bacterium]|nr:glycerate kinase [Actinomycetaceae bacterium]
MSDRRVIIACDKFKGSLDARTVTSIIEDEVARLTTHDIRSFLVADGGDGTLEALRAAGFASHPTTATGPTGEAVDTSYLERDGVAVVEMADACGLLRLPGGKLAPTQASSEGLGQVIRAALGKNPREVIIGVGGSASTDGGVGMLAGLGAKFFAEDGSVLAPSADNLAQISSIDLDPVRSAIEGVTFTLASDVDNPLLGEKGAVAIFGPQKGLEGDNASRIETGLTHWADLIAEETGDDLRDTPGAGAAGGVGFAAQAVLGARMRPGIALVLELAGAREALRDAALVITGEGSLDEQTLMGKTVAGVAAVAKQEGVKTVAVCGRNTLDDAQLASIDVSRAYALASIEADPKKSMANAEPLLRRRLADLVSDWL